MLSKDKIKALAVMEAIKKSTAALMSTKDPDSFRAEVDREFREKYEREMRETGTAHKTNALYVDGPDGEPVKVGTHTLVYSDAKPEQHALELRVTDFEKLARWFNSKTDEELRNYVALNLKEYADFCFGCDGEVAGGCEPVDVITPAVPPRYLYATLKVDPEKVEAAVGRLFAPGIAGLLEEGER